MDARTDQFRAVELVPEQVLETISVHPPSGEILVRGTVSSLNLYKGAWVYGTLKGEEGSISFRCPKDQSPKQYNDTVVLGGRVTVKPSTAHDGLTVMLQGVVVDTWEKQYGDIELVIPKRETARLSLSNLVKLHDAELGDFVIAGTERALGDFREGLNSTSKYPWTEVKVRVSTARDFFSDLSRAIKGKELKGLAILRGGANSEKGMRVWDDAAVVKSLLDLECPLYSAIGHTDGYVLLDKYADEAFGTPNQFGCCLSESLRDYNHAVKRERKYSAIEDENLELDTTLMSTQQGYRQKLTEIDNAHQQEVTKLKNQITNLMWGLGVVGALFLMCLLIIIL